MQSKLKTCAILTGMEWTIRKGQLCTAICLRVTCCRML
jgi:hypothetical protein